MSSVTDHLNMARQYLSEALKLLERGDPFDAAEKIWATVEHATTALTMSVLGEAAPPKRVSWRSFVKEAFVKAGLSREEASKWASYFIDVRSKLHGDCFHGLTYEEEEHKPLMESAGEYVDLVDGVLKRTERGHDEVQVH
jgi:HEPN domain-containing protein